MAGWLWHSRKQSAEAASLHGGSGQASSEQMPSHAAGQGKQVHNEQAVHSDASTASTCPSFPGPQRLALLRSAGARPEVRKKSRASLSATRPSPSASANANQASTVASGTPSTGSTAGGVACAVACTAAGAGARGGLPPGRMGAGPRRPASSLGSRSCSARRATAMPGSEHEPLQALAARRLPPLRCHSPSAAATLPRRSPRTPACLGAAWGPRKRPLRAPAKAAAL